MDDNNTRLTVNGTLLRIAVGCLLGYVIGSLFTAFVLPNVEGAGETIAMIAMVIICLVAGFMSNKLLIRAGLR